jgi:hypothetical protein
MITNPILKKFLQAILHTEDESKQNHERKGSIKPQENSIDSTTHNQIIKEQKT